ncbi:MAG TPA: hypothetical protein VFS26_05640 [Solirubrobacterales bacterium]|nr:hypothetical protein [Solirubrobacterales bacterium]
MTGGLTRFAQGAGEMVVNSSYEAALFRHFVEACRLSPVAA